MDARTQADLFKRASAGEAEAQVMLSRGVWDVEDMHPESRLMMAEVFARMAACQSSATGFRLLASVLSRKAGAAVATDQRDEAVRWGGHALAIHNFLSDVGDLESDGWMEVLMDAAAVDGLKDEIVATAKEMAGADLALV